MDANIQNIITAAPYAAFLFPPAIVLSIYLSIKKESRAGKILALIFAIFSGWCCMTMYEGIYYMIVRIN